MTCRESSGKNLVMAEADPNSSGSSELVNLKHMSFFVGFGAKDSDAGKSPTSPLDFGVFANFGGLFSPRSPAPSSPRFCLRNKWVSDKVGLSVLSSSIGEGHDDHTDSFRRDNIVLAPQIKVNVHTTPIELFDPCAKSVSLNIHNKNVVEEYNSPRRSSSSPMDIISSQAYSSEMALSEAYTCIISHGPNSKTTHIFGDCILGCDPKELGSLGSKEEIKKPQECHNQREKKTEKGGAEDSLDISPGSSYNEVLFPMAMPLNT